MATIERLELFHVTVPLAKPFYPSWIPGYPQTECRFTLLKMTTKDGIEGFAAGNAFENEREGLGSLLGPYLIGIDPTDIPRVRQLLREASFLGWQEAKVFLEKGSLDIYQPDATFCGGLATSKVIYEACLEKGLEFTPHTWSNGVGFITNLHAFAAYPERKLLEYPFEPPGWVPEGRDAILEEPIDVTRDGTVAISQEPGLGLRIDPKKLRRYGKRFYRMNKVKLAVHTIRKKGLKTALALKKKKEATRANS